MERKEKLQRLLRCAAAIILLKKKQQKRRKRMWTKSWLQRRNDHGSFATICQELNENGDEDVFQNYVGMPSPVFYDLLQKITPLIARQNTKFRDAIPPGARLEATLRYLTTGDTLGNLQYVTKISRHSLGTIIPETCDAIYRALKDDYIKTPSTPEEWLDQASNFERKWNFPHCIGAVGGKHIQITAPCENASKYLHYKGKYSIVLLAVCNAEYEFTHVDIGTNGRASDERIWNDSKLREVFESDKAHLPEPSDLPNSSRKLPYVLVADDTFPLETYLMKPYPPRFQIDQQEIFSYRQSRARRVVENALGVLASNFGVLHKTMTLHPKKVEKIVRACIALHNFLRRENGEEYLQCGTVDEENFGTGQIDEGHWRHGDQLMELQSGVPHGSSQEANEIRTSFREYFCSEGAVPWQRRMCGMK